MGDGGKITDSTEVRLGSLSVTDLLWRVPEATPGDTTIADIVLVALSIFFDQITLLESVTMWLLIGYASFTLASKAYPGLWFPRERRGFRSIFAAATVAGVAILPVIRPDQFDTLQLLSATLIWIIIFSSIFIIYLHRLGWRVEISDERTVETLSRVVPRSQSEARQQWREEWREPGWHGTFNRVTAWTLLGILATFPGFLAAIATSVLLAASPLGELFFLSAVTAAAVRKRTRIGSNRSARRIANLETYFYDSVSHALRNPHGIVLIMYLFSGILLVSLTGLSITAAFFPSIVAGTVEILFGGQEVFLEGWELYLLLSVFIGAMTLVVSGCAYATWAGLREVPRLAAFIDLQQGRKQRDVPPRPTGFIVPGILMLPLFFAVVRSLDTVSGLEPIRGNLRMFAIGWPLILCGLIMCWWLTHRRDPPSVENENHVIIASTGLLLIILGVISNLRVVVLTPATVMFGYWPYVSEYADQYDDTDIRQYAVGVYFILLGLTTTLLALAVSLAFGQVLGVLLLIFGVASLIVTTTDPPANGPPEKYNANMDPESDHQQSSSPTDSPNEDKADNEEL